jgi:hypothetical protein
LDDEEPSLDLPSEVDELPSEAEVELAADEVLSARAAPVARASARAVAAGRACFRKCCMKVGLRVDRCDQA